MKAVLFDFGNTLVSSGLPLNWQEFYREALVKIMDAIGISTDTQKIEIGEKVLRRYNTRVNPREYEVTDTLIFFDLFQEWGFTDLTRLDKAKDIFFSYFLGRTTVYPETESVLREIKKRNLKTGVLTDTAYGADKKYLVSGARDIVQYIDFFLASTEVGLRKPNTKGYLLLVKELNANPADCLFVGDEEKDIIGANKAGMLSVLIDRSGKQTNYSQQYTIKSLTEILNLI
jgi:putative hydrolase of the HAD superfamily